MDESQKIQNLKNEAISLILRAQTSEELAEIRLDYLGRKGKVNQLLQNIGQLPAAERATFGQALNLTKQTIDQTLTETEKKLTLKNSQTGWFDVTLPATPSPNGHLHSHL